MTKKNKNINKKRESILDAAAEAFIQDGYDNASMDKISERAGASKRTVYNHFRSKEDLFRAVLARFFDEIMESKKISYDPQESLEDQLGAFANSKLEISKTPPWLGLMKVAIGVFITNPSIALETIRCAQDVEDTLKIWLAAAVADGRMKVEDTKLAAKAFWAMMGGAFFWPSIFFGPLDAKETSAMKEELIKIFLAQYRAS